jgi:tRNA uridine 5-carboxymethylaminomethyl modification enzyme
MSGCFDVVVVGGGHAGCEAAAAACRMGLRVALVTLARRTVGEMPCNPAIGGIGKGHLVAELDAVGGVQGWAADRCGVLFKTLNRSRGPAVWGPWAQCDKLLYANYMRRLLEGLPRLEVMEGEVVGLIAGDTRLQGVRLADGRRVRGREVVLTTGTFLGGILHTGGVRRPGGRFGEAPSEGLGDELTAMGHTVRRFKTGTPPRLDRASLDLDRLEVHRGDPEPRPFSWRSRRVRNRCVCWVTRTPAVVQRIIQDNLHRSPLFTGRISGIGPRYCPSIEDKVVRFPHHEEHTVFLEMESLQGTSIYVNGLSTSLPRDVQEAVVRVVPGLEGARFLRYGYAVEYDVVRSQEMDRTLASRVLPGLRIAGQLLGTSGYEEAAALGLVAGVNAALAVRGEAPWVPGREEAYLGVLLDDLCGSEHTEPYRMFTSRAEHRLLLGVDSARERLMATGRALGLVPDHVFHVEQERWARRRRARELLEGTRLTPNRATREEVARVAGVELRGPASWAQILRRHDVEWERVAGEVPGLAELEPEERRLVVGLLRYDGYLARQAREVERVRRLRDLPLPEGFDPTGVPGLSRQVVEELIRWRPRTIAEAERLPGVTAAAVAILVARVVGGRWKGHPGERGDG